MHLTLRYHDTALRPATAAFLRGADAGAWLREIGRWGLTAEQVRCFLVPESIRSVRVAGLLVVAAPGLTLPPDVLEPFGEEAGRLYLPTHASLWPATTPEELRAALLWPRQCWHPAIGLVGFEETDALELAALLDVPAPSPADWTRARPGPTPPAPLRRLHVQPPSAAEVLQQLQQDIGTTPLAALPKTPTDEPGRLRRTLDAVLRPGLLLMLRLLTWLQRRGAALSGLGRALRVLGFVVLGLMSIGLLLALLAPGSGSGHFPWGLLISILVTLLLRNLGGAKTPARPGGATPARPNGKPGLLSRLGQWLGQSMQDLQRRRNNEVERLLRMFGSDIDQALRYAIPIGGQYADRGTAPASDTLGARNPWFNLGGLGGGGPVDAWDLGHYEQDLRRQYLAAAEREVAAGRFQKAAYIHAHLLGDYRAAAGVLEQGGLYREAAALYRDHLHNPAGAAQCLERGGLLLEAAELYAGLDQHEHAGDLYQRLEQPQLAARHYERATQLLLQNHDHPAAARLLADKLHAPERAGEVLLQGWDAARQPEVCLRQYLALQAAAPTPDLGAAVRHVYAHHTPPARRAQLLQVLAAAVEAQPDSAMLPAAREVAYEVAATEAAAGNRAPLNLLRHFHPTDPLLPTDARRYLTSRPPRPATPSPGPVSSLRVPQLDTSIRWISAVAHAQQWLAVGLRDERLHLARANWQGHVEYYSWTTALPSDDLHVLLLADEQHTTRILLRPNATLTLDSKLLPANAHFPQGLIVECPHWLPGWPARLALRPEGAVATAQAGAGPTLELQLYSPAGQAQPVRQLQLPSPAADALTERPSWPCEMLYQEGRYYTYWQNCLATLDETTEQVSLHPLGTQWPKVVTLVRSAYDAELRLAATTTAGLLLWRPRQADSATAIQTFEVDDEDDRHTELQFVGPEHVVTYDLHDPDIDPDTSGRAHLFRLTPAGAELLRTYEQAPVAVLPTSDRRYFGLLTSNGSLTLHELPLPDEG